MGKKKVNGGVPPSFENVHQLPGMQGAKILNQPQPVTTQHQTVFHSCQGGVYAVLENKTNRVIGYQFVIQDPHNSHKYVFPFGNDLRDEFLKELGAMPRQGEVAQEPEAT